MSYVDPYSGGTSGGTQGPGPYGSSPAPGGSGYGSAPSAGPDYGAPSYGSSASSAPGAPSQFVPAGAGYGSPAGSGYGAPSGPGYGAPRKRKGIKRTIFGALGLIANAIGLVVMPVLAGIIAATITVGTGEGAIPLGPSGGTFTADTMSVHSIAVPASEAATAECTATGASLERELNTYTAGEIDGVDYVEIYDVRAASGEVTVECTGVSAVAYTEMGMAGTLIGLGIGFVIPIGLGLVSLVLLIWGIIALIRS
ncbi:hypothetical protein [Brachybacterium phenoliresistens]|uniref:Uncharacterized protein n=1 Tax=Brachybacterium phenoliresistens TaxID=396014 RepID=Z9JW99_9MICO|nr:hypothetical protein [Brachybacterium phenoliresistens]EWS82061.1 hypothetical protein BF93_13810 [Brachybacterium phenoliresistens]